VAVLASTSHVVQMKHFLAFLSNFNIRQSTGLIYVLSRGMLIATIVGLAFFTGLFDDLERWGYNMQFLLRGPIPPVTPVVIVTIDEDSFDELDLQWPWPRALHGHLVDIITRGKPAAIGFDLIFAEPSGQGEQDDQRLAAAIRRAGNVVLAAAITESQTAQYFKQDLNPPVPDLLEAAAAYGYVNFNVDNDAFVRSGSVSRMFLDKNLSSFDLQLYRLSVNAGLPHKPLPQEPSILINYRGRPNTFRTVSYYRVLNGEVSPDIFLGQIVLVGSVSPLLHDVYPTPFAIHGEMPGVEIHANALETLMQGLSIHSVPRAVVAVFVLLCGLIAVGVTHRFRPVAAAFFVLFLVTAYIGISIIMFTSARMWLEIFPVALTGALAFAATTTENFIREKRQRAFLMKLFGRHVSQEVADAIWEQRDQFLDGNRPRSQELVVTILFTDLKGFTSVSEKMTPQALLDWLNNYMETMVKVVMDHNGVVDDYAGDSIKVNFGVPVPRSSLEEIKQDATNAVECALQMERELERLNQLYEQRNLPKVGMRVGIASGLVVAGSIGGSDRLKYTTVGDTVNVASRLESYDKDTSGDPYFARSRCRILTTEKTLQYLQGQFIIQPLGQLDLKGKEQKIRIYRMIGRKGPVEPAASLRQTPRVEVEAETVIGSEAGTFDAPIRDMSTKGVSVHDFKGRLQKGEAVRLQLVQPDGHRLELRAVVIWSQEEKAGMMFMGLSPDHEAFLEQFMTQHRK
jgi:adenylate cyclase